MTKSPFPGMDPYLEHPRLWQDVHNRLIAALADAITLLVAPRYYVGLERHTYLIKLDEDIPLGKPDIAIIGPHTSQKPLDTNLSPSVAVLEVDVPISDEVGVNYLEVREVETETLVTLLEILSPVNKVSRKGRQDYEEKRDQIFRTRTNLIEIDLLRSGEPMQIVGPTVESDYRILVSRGVKRPRAQLYPFSVRHAIPAFPLPLLPADEEPTVELGEILHALYTRARFDLRLNYTKPPVPPLRDEDGVWAQNLIHKSATPNSSEFGG
jgi:hypothetical protein